MIEEINIKSHLIVTDVHEEYSIKWCGKIKDTKPIFKNGKPIFVVVGTKGRIELNTTDMKRIENCAKLLTRPKGRSAITTDTARIYIKEEDEEEDDKETLLGVLTHNHVKTYAQMYDKVRYY